MANLTIKGKNFNSKLVSISDKPNVMESGAKYVWVGYEHNGSPKNLVLQTPYMTCPFGMNCFDKGEYPKYSTELSFSGVESDKNLKSFYDNLESFDEHLVDAGVKNSMSWFKKKKASRDAIQKRLASQKREPRPGEPGFTWYAKIPEKMNLSGLKRIRKGKLAAKKAVKSKRQHDISRKLIKMKQKANSKSADLRPIKVSVQGRGL